MRVRLWYPYTCTDSTVYNGLKAQSPSLDPEAEVRCEAWIATQVCIAVKAGLPTHERLNGSLTIPMSSSSSSKSSCSLCSFEFAIKRE